MEKEIKEEEKEIKEEEKNEESGNDTGKKAEEKKEQTYTKQQLDEALASATENAVNETLKKMGINTTPSSDTFEDIKEYLKSKKTPEQIAQEEKQVNDTKMKELEIVARKAKIKAEALALDVKPESADDLVILVLSSLKDDKKIKETISEFKMKYPALFKDSNEDDDEQNIGKKGTGSSLASKKKNNKKGNEKTLGQKIAEKINDSSKNKSSIW